MRAFAPLIAGLLLAACADPPGNPIVPGLKTESYCRASGNPMRCKMENALAGGYPIDLGPPR